jgi:uncharacterized protein YecT (DUF1311 family)
MRRAGLLLLGALLLAGRTSATAADAPARCPDDAVPWKGGCFDRYQWEPGDKTCPEGVIVIPDGEKQPRCVACDGYDGMQQPTNYCAGLLAERVDAKLKDVFQTVLTRFPAREAELRAAQATWTKSRDKACRRKEKEFEGGSMASEVYSECMSARTRKRTAELQRMIEPANKTCGGNPAALTAVDKRAVVVAEKSRFHAEPKACPASGECTWLRKGYVVRGDEVLETAVSGDFACVTFKATTGWLPLRDLGPPPPGPR